MTASKLPPDQEVFRRIDADSVDAGAPSRRAFLGGAAAATVAATALLDGGVALASPPSQKLSASPPSGFVPFAAPGRIVKVKKADSLMPNGNYPKPDDAKEMLRRALQEFTGKSDMAQAAALFVHPQDKVCVKVNGIAGDRMGTNRELVLPFLEAMIAAGVPAQNITVLEQFGSYLQGTRINAQNVPRGVQIALHQNNDATMDFRPIPTTGQQTKFVRAVTESTAIINVSLIKDHSICGYTGCIKNLTHGCIVNPSDFHAHHASPQIALLAAQDVLRSRVRLNITDGFKLMAQGGPLYRSPNHVIPHEAVYVSTDIVAMDAIGWDLVEKAREDFKLPSLTTQGRAPAYIQAAADLGLGVADRNAITVKEVTI
jgi:uncharacterized protein (DUF362 family)